MAEYENGLCNAENQANRERHKKYIKEWRKVQIELKRCTICGKQDERTKSGKTVCESCLTRCRENQRARQEKMREDGRCTKCGKTDSRTISGKYYCAECQAKRSEMQRKKNAAHMSGTCHRCGKVDERTASGKYLCEDCAEKARYRVLKYKRKNRQ